MPFYEYQCQACGHQLEALQGINEAPLTDCPECHKTELKKLVSASSFQLKGTGWYVTDFRDQGKKKSQDASSDQSHSNKSENAPGGDSANQTKSSEGTKSSGGDSGATTSKSASSSSSATSKSSTNSSKASKADK